MSSYLIICNMVCPRYSSSDKTTFQRLFFFCMHTAFLSKSKLKKAVACSIYQRPCFNAVQDNRKHIALWSARSSINWKLSSFFSRKRFVRISHELFKSFSVQPIYVRLCILSKTSPFILNYSLALNVLLMIITFVLR